MKSTSRLLKGVKVTPEGVARARECQESSLFLGYFHLLWQLPPTQPWEPSRNALEHSMMSSFLLEHSMMSSFCLECSMTSFCIPECSMMSSFLPECSMTSSFFQDVP